MALSKLIALIKSGAENFVAFLKRIIDDVFEWLEGLFKSGKNLDWLSSKIFRFSDDGNTFRNSIRLLNREEDAWYHIVTHGNKNGKKILHIKDYIGPEEYAKIIINSGWKGEPIRLVVCHSGSLKNGFAQKLATILKTTVEAPTKRIALNDFGEFIHETGGIFKTFKP